MNLKKTEVLNKGKKFLFYCGQIRGALHRDRSNSDTVRWMFGKCKKAKIDFHPPDCFIIADFYKNGINKVYSNNNHFLDACRLFGMDTSKLRTQEKEIEKQMREIFRKRRK